MTYLWHVEADGASDRFNNEMWLLGGLLAYGPVCYRATDSILNPAAFSDPFHAHLYDLIGKATDAGLEGFPKVHWVTMELRHS